MDIGFGGAVLLCLMLALVVLWPFLLPAIILFTNRKLIDRKGIFYLVGTGICWGIYIVSAVLIEYFLGSWITETHITTLVYFPSALLAMIIPVGLSIIAMIVMTGKFRRDRYPTSE